MSGLCVVTEARERERGREGEEGRGKSEEGWEREMAIEGGRENQFNEGG